MLVDIIIVFPFSVVPIEVPTTLLLLSLSQDVSRRIVVFPFSVVPIEVPTTLLLLSLSQDVS